MLAPAAASPSSVTTTTTTPPSSSSSIGTRVWRFFCDLIPDVENPKWNSDLVTVEQCEASLKTDAERKRRIELVSALKQAAELDITPSRKTLEGTALLSYDGGREGKERAEEEDPRLTIHIHSKEQYLIEPELQHYIYTRGHVLLIHSGYQMTMIFSQGMGTQAYAKRKAITEGMEVLQRTSAITVARIYSEKESQVAVQRARERGYRFIITMSLAIVVFFSCLQSVCGASAIVDPPRQFVPNVIEVLNLPNSKHLQLADTDTIESHHLHDIALPREHAKGMWLPSINMRTEMMKHRNSNVNRIRESMQDLATASTTRDWIDVPDSFHGSQNETFAILDQHGIDIAPLVADVQASSLANLTNNGRSTNIVKNATTMGKRVVNPLLVKAAIAAGGFITQSLFTAACQIASQAQNWSLVGKSICFVGTFLLSTLFTWGGLYAYARVLAGATPTASGAYRLSEITTGGISVVQGTGARRSEQHAMWFDDHMDMLQDLYADSLVQDRLLKSVGATHLDVNTGQELTMWDVLMSHIHPLRHSFVAGLNTTIWHESDPSALRQHTYTALDSKGTGMTSAQINTSNFLFSYKPSSLTKRQCEQSDTEKSYNESPSETWCETGSADGPQGVYNGYELSGTQDQIDSVHLKLGNDTYASEMARLEGALAYLGSVNGICETITYDGQTVYKGLREIERNGDQYAGFRSCK